MTIRPILVAPSILSADFANLARDIKRVEDAGADWIHVDVMDGHFVPNLTIGAPVVKSLRKQTKLALDCHLMVTDADSYLADFAAAGANHVIVHAEACVHLQRTLTQIRKLGMKAGVALNPATSEQCLTYVLDDLDQVLVMSVNPGFGGQKFIPAVIPKIAAIRKMLDQHGRKEVHIGVDGGMDASTAKLVINAGANVIIAGNSIYGSQDQDLSQAVAVLRSGSNEKIVSQARG